MADYYSILKKTIASLPESNGAARRSVYSRARNAIVNQLKAYEPPLSPSEITSEQLRLEEAIRKVEAEAAREALGLGAIQAKMPVSGQQAMASPMQATVPQPKAEGPQPAQASVETAGSEPAGEIPSPLKDTLSEAESLGSAANQAVQNAKEVVEPTAVVSQTAPQPSPPSEEMAPAPEIQGDAPGSGMDFPDPNPDLYADGDWPEEPKTDKAKKARSKRRGKEASDALRAGTSPSEKVLPLAIAGLLVLVVVAAAAFFLLPEDDDVGENLAEVSAGQTAAIVQPEEVETSAPSDVEQPDDNGKNTDRLLGGEAAPEVVAEDARTVQTTTITPQAPEAGQSAVPAEPPIATGLPEASQTPALVDTEQLASVAPVAVPEDNLSVVAPESAAPATVSDLATEGAQRAILYEEGENAGSSGTAAQGAAVWTLASETDIEGRQQPVLNATVDVPERDVKVDIRIKPNDDTSLPASHLVEIKYSFPESFAPGDVVNVPGLVMKPTEEARGDALIGASVKVSPGFFWIALSSLPDERARNLALLRERGWIDIPMLYENGKRGILTIEKGVPGADVVEKAIAAWEAG